MQEKQNTQCIDLCKKKFYHRAAISILTRVETVLISLN